MKEKDHTLIVSKRLWECQPMDADTRKDLEEAIQLKSKQALNMAIQLGKVRGSHMHDYVSLVIWSWYYPFSLDFS